MHAVEKSALLVHVEQPVILLEHVEHPELLDLYCPVGQFVHVLPLGTNTPLHVEHADELHVVQLA